MNIMFYCDVYIRVIVIFICRKCEKDFDGDGVDDDDDVSRKKILNFGLKCFFLLHIYGQNGPTSLYMSLKLYDYSSPDHFLKICPENKKISKSSFKSLETMDLCQKNNISISKIKMKMKMVMKLVIKL